MRLAALALAGLVLLPGAARALETVTLAVSGGPQGEVAPCACSAGGDTGGIARRATALARLRRQAPGVLHVSTGDLFDPAVPGHRLRSRAIRRGLARLGLDGVALGPGDTAYGLAPLRRDALPWLAGNAGGTGLPAVRHTRVNGVPVMLGAWYPPGADTARDRVRAGPATPVLAALRAADARGALTVLLTSAAPERARAALHLAGIDVLAAGRAGPRPAPTRVRDGTLVVHPAERGMRLVRLTVEVNARGEVALWRHQTVPLRAGVPDFGPLDAWQAAYAEARRADYRARVARRERARAGETPYVGADGCRACHGPAHAAWRRSDHADARADLTARGKAADPGCLRCHVVGWGGPGGYMDPYLTPHLGGVQCESCHGPSREHVATGGVIPPPRPGGRRCRACHTPENSPGFDRAAYAARLRHDAATLVP